jgi:hypothetical protein
MKKVNTGVKLNVIFVIKEKGGGKILKHCCFFREKKSGNREEIDKSRSEFESDLKIFQRSIGSQWVEDSYVLDITYL